MPETVTIELTHRELRLVLTAFSAWHSEYEGVAEYDKISPEVDELYKKLAGATDG